jgi:signal transduction histidine kinase
MSYGQVSLGTDKMRNVDANSHEVLVEELENGLHALAQPLTVLRGALGSLKLREAVAPAHARYLEMSEEQIERLCQLVFGLQSLLDAAENGASREFVNLWDLTSELIRDHEMTLRQLGIRIAASVPELQVNVIGDPNRIGQALNAALITAARFASRNGVIELDLIMEDGFVNLRVQIRDQHLKGINSANRLNLAIAKANTLSQQGIFEFAEDPFSVSMKLPFCILEDSELGRARYSPVCQVC